jgi:metal-dependent HD superfamily phosphatase/phosphodiesterase
MEFKIPSKNEKLRRLIHKIEGDEELNTLWRCANVVAMDRLRFSDHGSTHVKIVANAALKLCRLLQDVEMPGVVKDYKLPSEDSEIVIFLASVLHDIGMVVQRDDHQFFSTAMAFPILERLLSDYPPEERTIIISETLHAISSHYSGVPALTKEAGIFIIADALDMAGGRARVPFDAGKIDIHSVSALSIDRVEVLKGEKKPVTIKIYMSNSAGIFQVDELLGSRVKNSGLGPYIEVVAEIAEVEKKILHKFELH